MSKFIKRLRKSGTSNLTNIIVLGTAFGNLSTLLEVCHNVFSLNSVDSGIRSRNLIYRENFNDTQLYPEIQAVFVDRKHIYELAHLKQILVRFTPSILIEGENFLSKEERLTIGSIGYNLIDISKGIQTWKIQS